MSKAYFRFLNEENFNDDGNLYFETDFDFIENHNLWSDYFLQTPTVDIANMHGLLRDNDYVLCVLYGNRLNDTFSDVQFATSETAKYREKDINTLKRTLGEELGLGLRTSRIPSEIKYGIVDRLVTIYSINIRDTVLNSERGTVKTVEAPGSDDRFRKTAVCVYGNKRDICSYLNNPNIFLDKSEDKIVGFVAVKFSDAKRYFNDNNTTGNTTWTNKEKRRRRRYFK